jgi:predicted metalloendopeptidase
LKAQCIVDQYSGYRLDNIDLPINGKMTQGENIADNGGLKQVEAIYQSIKDDPGREYSS